MWLMSGITEGVPGIGKERLIRDKVEWHKSVFAVSRTFVQTEAGSQSKHRGLLLVFSFSVFPNVPSRLTGFLLIILFFYLLLIQIPKAETALFGDSYFLQTTRSRCQG